MPLSIAISRIRVRCGAGASEEKLQSCALVLWFRKPVMIIRAALLLTLALTPLRAAVAQIQEPKPKLASAATPLLRPDDYLRSHPAPDFWTLLAFYVPQATDAACSVASITMALNAARGLPPSATDPIITQQRLLERVADARWTEATVQGGPRCHLGGVGRLCCRRFAGLPGSCHTAGMAPKRRVCCHPGTAPRASG